MDIDKIQAICSTILGVSGLVFGWLSWYRGAIEKRYAAERAFTHIRANQETLVTALKQQDETIESIKELLNERFYQLNTGLTRLEVSMGTEAKKKQTIHDDHRRELS
jgi:hypothetical protein